MVYIILFLPYVTFGITEADISIFWLAAVFIIALLYRAEIRFGHLSAAFIITGFLALLSAFFVLQNSYYLYVVKAAVSFFGAGVLLSVLNIRTLVNQIIIKRRTISFLYLFLGMASLFDASIPEMVLGRAESGLHRGAVGHTAEPMLYGISASALMSYYYVKLRSVDMSTLMLVLAAFLSLSVYAFIGIAIPLFLILFDQILKQKISFNALTLFLIVTALLVAGFNYFGDYRVFEHITSVFVGGNSFFDRSANVRLRPYLDLFSVESNYNSYWGVGLLLHINIFSISIVMLVFIHIFATLAYKGKYILFIFGIYAAGIIIIGPILQPTVILLLSLIDRKSEYIRG